ncbi:MAG: hypothetical protein AAGA95_13185 [Pseudomonadota bacterium]
MNKILLKTTIPRKANDWCAHRFLLLKATLTSAGYQVESRDRVTDGSGDDVDLASLPDSDYDQLWIFGVEGGEGGLTRSDAASVDRFRRNGKGCMLTRDHMDVGYSLVRIPQIGLANHFHSVNPEPDVSRRTRDDTFSMHLDWPNYHSGLNGAFQELESVPDGHPLFKRVDGVIRYFPTHPHEGAISVPAGAEHCASVVAKGRSGITGVDFNLIVAFEALALGNGTGQVYGRAAIHSSFHHFVDYNWDAATGCPDFVTDPEDDAMAGSVEAQKDIRSYSLNLARWLSNDS